MNTATPSPATGHHYAAANSFAKHCYYITRNRAIAQAKKDLDDALYFFKWLEMGSVLDTKTTCNPLPDTTPAAKDTALHSAPAVDSLTAASQGFVTAIHAIPAVHDNLTNSISALIATARKRPVDTAALIAASERVVAAAAAVEPATQQLIYSTATLTAAAKEVHYTTVPKSDTAELPHTTPDKVADFFNPCVNDEKLAA